MIEPLAKLVESLTYWLGEHGDLECKVSNDRGDQIDIELIDDEGEEFYIGSYADPGMTIKWIGAFTPPGGNPVNLVMVNGLVFEAHARSIAGWVVGLQ